MIEKILIFPDIHTKYELAENIIDKEDPNKIIFLGDYFDDFGDNIYNTEETALWLKESLEKPNRTHLLGNHDLSYLNQKFITSGFSNEKLLAIKNSGVDLEKLTHYCWIDDWLCTHAGLSNKFYKKYGNNLSVKEFLIQFTTNKKLKETLYDCSHYRGGSKPFGGIVWCDYEEFTDIPNVKQIFGHTRSPIVRRKKTKEINSEHICLDTELHNYAVYQNKEMIIKSVSDKAKI